MLSEKAQNLLDRILLHEEIRRRIESGENPKVVSKDLDIKLVRYKK